MTDQRKIRYSKKRNVRTKSTPASSTPVSEKKSKAPAKKNVPQDKCKSKVSLKSAPTKAAPETKKNSKEKTKVDASRLKKILSRGGVGVCDDLLVRLDAGDEKTIELLNSMYPLGKEETCILCKSTFVQGRSPNCLLKHEVDFTEFDKSWPSGTWSGICE